MSDDRTVLQFDPRRRRTKAKDTTVIEIPYHPAPVRRRQVVISQADHEISLTSLQHPPGYNECQRAGWFEPYDQDLLGTDRWPVLQIDTDHGPPMVVGAWERALGRARIWSWSDEENLLYDPDAYARMSRRYPYATFVREIQEAMEADAAFEEKMDLEWLLKCSPEHQCCVTFASGGHIMEYRQSFADEQDEHSAQIIMQLGWPDIDALRFAIEEYGVIGIAQRELSSLEDALQAHIIERQARK